MAAQSFDVLVDRQPDVGPHRTGGYPRAVAGSAETERPQIVMMTAHATVESAIEAMKLGALDYLQKPFEVDELLVVVTRAVEHQRLHRQHRYLISELDEAVRSLRHRRTQPCDAGSDRARRAGCRNQEHRAHHRRDRDGQGAGRTRDPRPQRAARHAAHQSELRGDPRHAARIGAVRARPRRVHRRDHEKKGKFALADGGTSSSTRSAR